MNNSLKICPFCKNQIPFNSEICPVVTCKRTIIERLQSNCRTNVNSPTNSIHDNPNTEKKNKHDNNPSMKERYDNKTDKIKSKKKLSNIRVIYKLSHFSQRENFNFDYLRGRITYQKKYLINDIVSYRPEAGVNKEIVICPICKREIIIRIASESRALIFNRFYKSLALIFFCSTLYLLAKTPFVNWILIAPVGGIISVFLFFMDYGEPKVIKDIYMGFVGHKIFKDSVD